MNNKNIPDVKKETPALPPGAVRPIVQLTPNYIYTESIRPKCDGDTKSVLETIKKTKRTGK